LKIGILQYGDQASLFFDRPPTKRRYWSKLAQRCTSAKNRMMTVNKPSWCARIRAERKLSKPVTEKHVPAGGAHHLPAPPLMRSDLAKRLEWLLRQLLGVHDC
jgi:hypothetical protein